MKRAELGRKAREIGVVVSWHTRLEGKLSVRRREDKETVVVETPEQAWIEAQRLARR